MKKSWFDKVIKIMYGIDLLVLVWGLINDDRFITIKGFKFFIIISIPVFFYLFKNKIIFRKKEFFQYNLSFNSYNDISNYVHNKLVNNGYIVDESGYKRYINKLNKDSVIVITIFNDINYKGKSIIINDENIKYMYDVSILVVNSMTRNIYKKINISTEGNKVKLSCVYSLEEKKLYVIKDILQENVLKYLELKNKLLDVFEIAD